MTMVPNMDSMVPNSGIGTGGGGSGTLTVGVTPIVGGAAGNTLTDNGGILTETPPIAPGSILAGSALNFYVNPNNASNVPAWGVGNDSNNGLTRGAPKLTMQAAYNELVLYNYEGAFSPSIILADGDYTSQGTLNLVVPTVGSGASPGYFNLQSDSGNYANVILRQIYVAENIKCNATNLSFFSHFGLASIDVDGGQFGGNGTFGFNGTGSPFPFKFSVGAGTINMNGATINIGTPADGQGWSNFVEADLAGGFTMQGAHVNLPPLFDLTVAGGYFVSMSGSYNQAGVVWTNFAGVNGPNLQSFALSITTDNGEISDIPGNQPPQLVGIGTIVSSSITNKFGTEFLILPGPLATVDVPQTTWTVVKDATSGNHYVVFNDGGNLYVKQVGRIPNTRTANYVLAFTDQDGRVEMNLAGANTVTVPPNASVAFPIGAEIKVTQIGAGITSFVAGAGVTINNNVALTQWATAVLYQSAINIWTRTGA